MHSSSPESVWEEALGRLLTREEASELVGSKAELADLEASGALIVLTQGSGDRCHPSRQFVDDRPVPGLAAAHRRMTEAVSSWTAASFALGDKPHPELDGLSVREFAARGLPLDRLMLVTERDAAALAH